MKPYFRKAGMTIFHGDCREVLPALKCDEIGLLLTDPPYGINLRENSEGGRHGKGRTHWELGIQGDESQSLGCEVLDWAEANGLPTITFASPKKPWPRHFSSFLVWDKGPAVGGGGDVKRCWKQTWELIQVARTGILAGKRDPSVLKFWVMPQSSQTHPAAKPVPLLVYLIGKVYSTKSVLDPFLGVGSTLIAAQQLKRRAIGIEIEERYCEIAARRLEGKKALPAA